ncbi:MAG: ATP-dependent Clp protease adaptor ClpS [Campylobacter sp.]
MPKIKENERGDVALKDELKRPKKFKVLLLNDDITHMDFVVSVLIEIFHHTNQSAVSVMLEVHKNGQGVAGIYTKDIAQTKQNEVRRAANAANFPLKTKLEEE